MTLSLKKRTRVTRVNTDADRLHAITVLKATYHEEKNWVANEQKMFLSADLQDPKVSWFVVFVEEKPVGVLRVLYELPLDVYKEYGFKQLGQGIDIEAFVKANKIAEIGRFAVLPEYRKYIVVVGALMREASKETVARGFTHYITDIFEGEKHSPYLFHTRVMGFIPVATHDVGELNCPLRRITMVLDIKAAYNRLRDSNGFVFRFLTEDWDKSLHEKLRDNDPKKNTEGMLLAMARAYGLVAKE